MEALIHPDIGLSFWTIVCFIILLVLLKKTAWQPLADAINEREEGLRRTMESADKAKKEAEQIRDELNSRLAELKGEIKQQLAEARKMANKEKENMLAEAKKDAASIINAAKKELEMERVQALKDMRRRVSEISLLTAGKVLGKAIDADMNAKLADKCLMEVEKSHPELSRNAGIN